VKMAAFIALAPPSSGNNAALEAIRKPVEG
jgi:hypothetical protein